MQPPDTPFEALTGVPAPRDDVTDEPLNLENAGGACDFCPGADSPPPVVWAYPVGQAEQSVPLGDMSISLGMPIAPMLWYACERCRRHIKADRWADLARDCGYPEGSTGSAAWQSFRVARLPGPGYAWPLVAHKLPTVHKRVREAWKKGKGAFAQDVRQRLARAVLLLEFEGHLYVRCGLPGDDTWLVEHVGEPIVAPFSFHLGGQPIRLTLLPAQP